MPAIRDWLIGTFAGRALIVGSIIKSATLTLAASGASISGALGVLDTIGGISLIAAAAVLGYRLFVVARRRLLWRVRRKLTLSYIFIGFVPALLIISFFLLAGVLLFFNVSSYLVQSRVGALVEQVRLLADTTALELERVSDPAEFRATLERRRAGAAVRHRESYALVPVDRSCASPGSPRRLLEGAMTAGSWDHVNGVPAIPNWIGCEGYAGLVLTPGASQREGTAGGDPRPHLAIRSVAFARSPGGGYAVVVDVPLGPEIARQLRQDTGIEVGQVTALIADGRGIDPATGAPLERNVNLGTTSAWPDDGAAGGPLQQRREWIAFLDYADWDTGRTGAATLAIRTSIAGLYGRISGAPFTQIGNFNFGQVLLLLLGVVAALFLVIQAVALGMGLGLARSITGSVHELFTGTERVRQGDFTHKIATRSRDQLGELAQSFNSMTASIEDLLQQKAEKERLEQELRIAREIQMSLLPQGPLGMPGLALTAHCEPAREVGGDYYDVLAIDDRRVGILIADVAGKGTSAALYMAELKGLVLALSRWHRSPRQLLMDANRIISRHLDSRSFITVTYAVIDLDAGTLTHARAGHCPLMYLPGPAAAPAARRVQVLTPDGLVLGLQIDNGERFDQLLEEVTLPIGTGDLIVLYTDGITEAMNPGGDYFGDARLAALLEQHGDLPFDQLRERILREIAAFVGTAHQQDDMTMVLVRVEEAGRPEDRPLQVAAARTADEGRNVGADL